MPHYWPRDADLIRASAILLLLVAGCAVQPLEKGLSGLVGEHIDAAADTFGFPAEVTRVGHNTIYVWDSIKYASVTRLNTSTSYTGAARGSSIDVTRIAPEDVPLAYKCEIKLSVDADGVITEWENRGSHKACQYYANLLKRRNL